MAKPYSDDLRKKVMDYILAGNGLTAASNNFDVSLSAIKSWHKRYKQEGHYKQRKRPGKVAKVTDEELSKYVDENPNATLVQIGKHFGLTDATICYHLQRLGYRYKKKSRNIEKPAKIKEKNI